MKWRVLQALNRLVSRIAPQSRSNLEYVYFAVTLARNPRSFYRYLRLLLTPRKPVEVCLRGRPNPLYLRPGTTDAIVASAALGGEFHLPEVALAEDATIIDLGANIGVTAADFAWRYPRATVIAVEMDEGNFEMALLNTADYRDRVTVIHAAAWWESTRITYAPGRGEEWGFAVAENGDREVTAIAVADLVARYGPVDFVKMDIEGAEREILTKNTSWAADVSSIQVEFHEPYTAEQCEADLRKLGFMTHVHPRHQASINATRR